MQFSCYLVFAFICPEGFRDTVDTSLKARAAATKQASKHYLKTKKCLLFIFCVQAHKTSYSVESSDLNQEIEIKLLLQTDFKGNTKAKPK